MTQSQRDEIAECFNYFFTTIVETLGTEKALSSVVIEPFSNRRVDPIKKFKPDQGIVKIRQMTREVIQSPFAP